MLKLFLPALFLLTFSSLYSQTDVKMWSKSNPPVETSVDSNVMHIMIKLHESEHISRNPHVTYDKSTLDPFSCYRSLINRTTGTEFWFKVDCSELNKPETL